MVEDMTARDEYLIESFQVQGVGVGQRTVDVEQQRFP
jgi:hypothetical protein